MIPRLPKNMIPCLPSSFRNRRFVGLLSVLTVGMFALPLAEARHISPEDALARLKSAPQTALSAEEASVVSKITLQTRAASAPVTTIGNLYIYSADDSFMILPADDNSPVLLGYSDSSPFSTELNPALGYWLDFYNAELSAAPSADAEASTRAAAERPQRDPIAPLTKTKWNQEAPYNELCPKVDGRGTVTGCVATAMAQVMKFYSYPAQGTGSHSYYWEPGKETLSFDYGSTKFDWNLMTDTYSSESTEAERTAVATLMLACGISVDMHYDVGDSGAATMNMGTALMEYFGYDHAMWMPIRDYYGLYEWESMVYDELAEGRPVLYSGQGTAGGHQFICDGYNSDGFFHFNWGWGGLSDGYFRLTALNPASLGVGGGAGGFNSGQQIALGVKPKASSSLRTYLMYCTDHFLPSVTTISAGQELHAEGGFYNYSLSALPDGSRIGMKFTPTAGGDPQFVEGFNISGIAPLVGYDEDFVILPRLDNGRYKITPAFYDGTDWHEILAPVGAVGYIIADVDTGTATLRSPEAASVTVTDIEAPTTIYEGLQFPLRFSVVNNGEEEYIGNVYPVLMNSEGTVVASSVYRPVDIEAGATEKITDYIGAFSALKDEQFGAGDYQLLFRNHDGKEISGKVKITVEAAPASTTFKVTDFRLDGTDPASDKAAVRFAYTLTCEEGYFADRLHLYVFPGKGGGSLASAATDMIYLGGGEDENGVVTIDLSSLEDGDYLAAMYKGDKDCTDAIRFTLDSSSGVTVISSDPVNTVNLEDADIYDLNGVKATAPLHPGIYVINGRKVLIR